MDTQQIYTAVTERYSELSSGTLQSSAGYSKSVARSFGYSEEELNSIPAESNLGLSCGNPLATASLREGETIVDLGSGAGFDIFLAAKRVGPTGRAIGVDMNKDMLALAEKNKIKSGASNVEFVEGQITKIPLADGTADAIISNCVINLVPEDEKQLVFNEIFRLLKPGGRVAVSDILAKKPLPEKLKQCAAAYVGCVSGASLISQYQTYFKKAGFEDALIKDANADLNVYIETLEDGSKVTKDNEGNSIQKPSASNGYACCGPQTQTSDCCAPKSNDCEQSSGNKLDLETLAAELEGVDLNEWIGSYKIFAVKP